MKRQLQQFPRTSLWFGLTLLLFALFVWYTAIVSTGLLLVPTLQLEQWLLHRPLTRFDCVLVEWESFGEVPLSLFFIVLLGLGCLLLGYRRRILPYLLLLFLLGLGVEVGGKQLFTQPIPNSLSVGRNALSCPQISNQPRSVRWLVKAGMWRKAPAISPEDKRNEQVSAQVALTMNDAMVHNGYPSGHAIRWMFLGLLLSYLAWQHVPSRLLRIFLVALAFALALGGGFAKFYTGDHLSTDLLAGYFVGASTACCALALLRHNRTKKIVLPVKKFSGISSL